MSYGARLAGAITDRAIVFAAVISVMGPAAYCMRPSPAVTPGDPVIEAVTKRLMQEEGFRAHAYTDSVGVLTIGYGTNLAQGITEPQGACLLRLAATADLRTFAALWPPHEAMPFDVQVELADMAYQLGPAGAHGFRKMLGHLAAGEWDAAADEALDSRWNDETPARAERLPGAAMTGEGRTRYYFCTKCEKAVDQFRAHWR